MSARAHLIHAPVFPGDAACGAAVVGDCVSARKECAQHGWRVLAILSALMGFASISTDLYLLAMPAMGQALRADAATVEWTISCRRCEQCCDRCRKQLKGLIQPGLSPQDEFWL